MEFPRASGILLHPTSLPGRFGIGDLGDEARQFVDFLAASGQRLWQVLPLGPTGYGDSPYQCLSAFAGNTLLISPARLVDDGLLPADFAKQAWQTSLDRVSFGRVIEDKRLILAKAYDGFKGKSDGSLREEFSAFCTGADEWLDDYALFRVLKDENGGGPWNAWDPLYALRDQAALLSARDALREKVEAEKFYQFLFFRQWSALRRYGRDRDIEIIGDMPIFVAFDSADVWVHPELFKMDEEGRPSVVAGVPPDYFSATGQLWGNPIYDWERMGSDGFRWWVRRMRAALEAFDIVRLDHFRGFAACWEVPAGEKTATRGRWVDAPGRELFATLHSELGELPILAEDLGVITPEVEALRDDWGFPGMRVLQFAFRSDAANHDLPHNYVRNSVVYTGTHDNDTTAGWFDSEPGVGSTRDAGQIDRERKYCLKYLGSDGAEINWDFIACGFASVANTAIVPLQDVLGLDSGARMNLPATEAGNWTWRFKNDALTEKVGERLKELSELHGRA